jgi:hypothetical protein
VEFIVIDLLFIFFISVHFCFMFLWFFFFIFCVVVVAVVNVHGLLLRVQKNPRMAENFDPIFTRAKVELTPPDRNAIMILKHMNPAEFAEFDWVNPHYEPIVDPPLSIEQLSITSSLRQQGTSSARHPTSTSTSTLPITKEVKAAIKAYSLDKSKK